MEGTNTENTLWFPSTAGITTALSNNMYIIDQAVAVGTIYASTHVLGHNPMPLFTSIVATAMTQSVTSMLANYDYILPYTKQIIDHAAASSVFTSSAEVFMNHAYHDYSPVMALFNKVLAFGAIPPLSIKLTSESQGVKAGNHTQIHSAMPISKFAGESMLSNAVKFVLLDHTESTPFSAGAVSYIAQHIMANFQKEFDMDMTISITKEAVLGGINVSLYHLLPDGGNFMTKFIKGSVIETAEMLLRDNVNFQNSNHILEMAQNATETYVYKYLADSTCNYKDFSLSGCAHELYEGIAQLCGTIHNSTLEYYDEL